MIVRTAPVAPPAPNAIRALERLESQLRRAADDLHQEVAAMRAAQRPVNLQILGSVLHDAEPDTCGKWLPKAHQWCARGKGHLGSCRSREVMDTERDAKRMHRA